MAGRITSRANGSGNPKRMQCISRLLHCRYWLHLCIALFWQHRRTDTSQIRLGVSSLGEHELAARVGFKSCSVLCHYLRKESNCLRSVNQFESYNTNKEVIIKQKIVCPNRDAMTESFESLSKPQVRFTKQRRCVGHSALADHFVYTTALVYIWPLVPFYCSTILIHHHRKSAIYPSPSKH